MKAIFIDIDNTLLDFDEYVRTTMAEGFAHFGLPAYRPEMYHTFTTENNKLWRRIEEGTLTFEELQKIRWSRIFDALGIAFDGPTFEHYFRTAIYDSAIPVPGAVPLLQSLSRHSILCAASNGPYEQQLHRLELGGMKQYFTHFFISQRIGAAKPAAASLIPPSGSSMKPAPPPSSPGKRLSLATPLPRISPAACSTA